MPRNSTALAPAQPFIDAKSLRQQAAAHKILTAKLPLDALTTQWSIHPNRPITQPHVAELCALFHANGLLRQDDANFLLVKAPRHLINGITESNDMLDVLPQAEATTDTTKEPIFDLRAWKQFYPEHEVEVLAGQHRIKALEQYVEETGADRTELWWNCIVYDKETLPDELDAQLRVNPRDATLPDGHGQKWRQLTAAQQRNPRMLDERRTNKAQTERYLLQQLQLGGESDATVGRLITLWRKKAWREALTEWNATTVGYSTFNVNTFYWMSALRLDEAMLHPIVSCLQTMKRFPAELVQHIRASDWQVLAEHQAWWSWGGLFYPAAGGGAKGGEGERHKTLLSHVNDSIYKDILGHIEDAQKLGRMEFPNIGRFMKMARAEGDVLAAVMTHAVDWLNPNPMVIVNKQRSNKPQLREDLEQPVEDYLRDKSGLNGNSSEQVALIAEGCEVVEDAILRVAWRHMAFFTSAAGKATLKTRWADDPSYYETRIRKYRAWNDLYATLDDLFHPYSPLPWSRDDTTINLVYSDQRIATTALAIDNVCRTADWIVGNSVLNTAEAGETLAKEVRTMLMKWAIETQNKAGKPYGGESGNTLALPGVEGETVSLMDRIHASDVGDCWGVNDNTKRRGPADDEGTMPASKRTQRCDAPDAEDRGASAVTAMPVSRQPWGATLTPTSSREVMRQRVPPFPATEEPQRRAASSAWLESSAPWSVDIEEEMWDSDQEDPVDRRSDDADDEGLEEAAYTPLGAGFVREQPSAGLRRGEESYHSPEFVSGPPRQRRFRERQMTIDPEGYYPQEYSQYQYPQEYSQQTPTSTRTLQTWTARPVSMTARRTAYGVNDNVRTSLPETRGSYMPRDGTRSGQMPPRPRILPGTRPGVRITRR